MTSFFLTDYGATLTLSTGSTLSFPQGRWRPKVARLIDPDLALGTPLGKSSDDGFWYVILFRSEVVVQITPQDYHILESLILEAYLDGSDNPQLRRNLIIGMELDEALAHS
jgi:hypothetical protein